MVFLYKKSLGWRQIFEILLFSRPDIFYVLASYLEISKVPARVKIYSCWDTQDIELRIMRFGLIFEISKLEILKLKI